MDKNYSETKRLADAVASVAATMAELIDEKLKHAVESRSGFPTTSNPNATIEGWIKKRDVAKHLNVSQRTVDNWMTKGVIPYIRLGERRVLFKLSEVDEAVNRRFKRNSLL